MTYNPANNPKYYEIRNAKKRADPEYRKKVNRQNAESIKRRLESDPAYHERRKLAAKLRSKRRIQNDPEYREKIRQKSKLQRDRIKEDKAVYDRYRKKMFSSQKKLRYGINGEQWEAIFEAQGRACKICGQKDPTGRIKWCTDHITDENGNVIVRGILCLQCNTSLKSHLTPELLMKMAFYVKTHGSMEDVS